MKRRNEYSSARVARIAAIGFLRPELLTRKDILSLAGSVLTQSRNKKKVKRRVIRKSRKATRKVRRKAK